MRDLASEIDEIKKKLDEKLDIAYYKKHNKRDYLLTVVSNIANRLRKVEDVLKIRS